MSTNTSNRTITWIATTSTLSSPASQCIPWIVVQVAESLAIVVLNIITIIVFVKQRHLQRQSLYMIIHLAIVDLLAGAISGPMVIEYFGSAQCGLWEYSYSPLKYGLSRLFSLFPAVSFFNFAAMSLERRHATFRPFKHRFYEKTRLLCNKICHLVNGYNQGNRYSCCFLQNTNIRFLYMVYPV